MKNNILMWLSFAGLLFSGYLSGTKFFTGACAFNEGCPIFLGYPACYFGFAMFLMLTALIVSHVMGKLESAKAHLGVTLVSLLGILFAGYFTFRELPKLWNEGFGAYMLVLPTCALGLIFYVVIFTVALRKLRAVDSATQ